MEDGCRIDSALTQTKALLDIEQGRVRDNEGNQGNMDLSSIQ